VKLYSFITVLIIFTLASCQKDPEPGGTAVEKMAGQWFVKVNNAGNWYAITTYNTSGNVPNEMWLQVTGLAAAGITPVKGKVAVDLTSQTFSGENISNVFATTSATLPAFSVASGTVISGAATGPVSNAPADSINFNLVINGATFNIAGFHRTGFLEDEPGALNQ
jgi:hypothetical protein